MSKAPLLSKLLPLPNVAWNEETRNLYHQFAPNLEFPHLDALFEKVIVSGQHVIANGLGSHPHYGPTQGAPSTSCVFSDTLLSLGPNGWDGGNCKSTRWL